MRGAGLPGRGQRSERLRGTARLAGLIRWVGAALVLLGTSTTAAAVDCPLVEDTYERIGRVFLNAPCANMDRDVCLQHPHYAMNVGYIVGRLMSPDVAKSPEANACLTDVDRDLQRFLGPQAFNTYTMGHELGLRSRPETVLPDSPLVIRYDPFSEITALETYIARHRETVSSGEGTGSLPGLWRLVSVSLPNGQSESSFVGAIFEFSADGGYSIAIGGDTIRGSWRAGPGPNQLTTTIDGDSEVSRIVSANRSELILLDANGNRMVLSSN
eukprot:g17379.t1